MKTEPWANGKLRRLFDPYTKAFREYAIEDADGVLWSGECVRDEVARFLNSTQKSNKPESNHSELPKPATSAAAHGSASGCTASPGSLQPMVSEQRL